MTYVTITRTETLNPFQSYQCHCDDVSYLIFLDLFNNALSTAYAIQRRMADDNHSVSQEILCFIGTLLDSSSPCSKKSFSIYYPELFKYN